MARNLQSLIFMDQSHEEEAKKKEETSEDFSKNISWFLEVIISSKATRHKTLRNSNAGRETIVINTVIVVRRIPKRQVSAQLQSSSFHHSFM